MEEITKADGWQEALQLSKQLVLICEAFSNPEENVLVWHLRQAAIDVPAGIAGDWQAGRAPSPDPLIRLVATLELVHMVYPAIDTGDAIERLEHLSQHLKIGATRQEGAASAAAKVTGAA